MRRARGTQLMTRTQLVGPALQLVRDRGHDPATWIAQFALPASALVDTEITLPVDTLHELLEAIADALDEPLLGLALPAYIQRGTYGLLGYLWTTSSTIGEALLLVQRYMPLLNEVVVVSIERDASDTIVLHSVPGEPECLGRHANECWLAMTVQALAALSVIASRAWLAHANRGTRAELMSVLGVRNLNYDRGANGFAIPTSALSLPIASADVTLHAVLRDRAERELAERAGNSRLLGHVRHVVREQLHHRIPTLATTSRELRMTPRTLQRRLRERDTSFQELLESLRCDIACSLLRSGPDKVADVACALQYADESAFVRAFKRWKGLTPGAYRLSR